MTPAGERQPAAALGREVRSERLRLILFSRADADDLAAGRRQDRWHPDYPRPDDRDAAALVSASGGEVSPWGPRHVVHDGLAVGSIGFFGPPDESGEVEVGYGLVEPARGRGLITEALRALVAATDALDIRVRARVDPGNRPSVRALTKAGFTELRGANEDGELVMARPLPGAVSREAAPANPPRLPGLVATDLDGTLLHSDGTVTDRTRRIVAAVEAAGVPVVFVTARPLRWMEHLWSMVGDHGIAIVSNGAVVYDVAAREVREVEAIEAAAGMALVARISQALPGASYAVECLDGLRREEGWVDAERDDAPVRVGPIAEVWDEPAVKLLVRADATDPVSLQAAAVAAVGDDAIATWSVPGLVEISAAGVTKAAALARVCARLGIEAADVVAFGDMPNDLPMLRWAGTSYAVANADRSVRAEADRAAPANDDDGVARVLARLVPAAADLL